MRPRISMRGSVPPSVGPSRVFLNGPIMVGNDWENSLNGPNLLKSLPNCPKMSQNADFRRIVVRMDLLICFSVGLRLPMFQSGGHEFHKLLHSKQVRHLAVDDGLPLRQMHSLHFRLRHGGNREIGAKIQGRA